MSNQNRKNNSQTYIPSIEAEEAYDMSVRGLENVMKYEYNGSIPYSLLLIKLRSYKRLFAEKKATKNDKDKYYSDAVINIKFKNKIKDGRQIKSNVRGYDNLIDRLNIQQEALENAIKEKGKEKEESNNNREQEKLEKAITYLKNKLELVEGHIDRIKEDKQNSIYQELEAEELRKHLYTHGMMFKGRKYVFFQRTASKSRNSQTLFILEDLHDKMKDFCRMGLDLSGEIEVASLLSYESLVASSIADTVTINPDSVFIMDDEFSTFTTPAIEVGNDLKAKHNDKATITNNVWDGQALIDISLMESIGAEKYGSAQLRQAWFKCCAFTTRVQDFLRDNCPTDTNYEEWKLKDAFGNWIYAKDILLISTVSATKFLKMAKGEEKKAFHNWKKHIKQDKHLKNTFGICNFEHGSKYGDHSFTSYQMVNTLDIDKEGVEDLAKFEVDYIKSLQGTKNEDGSYNEEPFIEFLQEKSDISNAYNMLVDLYNVNPDIVRTKLFRDYRAKQIHNYRQKVRGGRLRAKGQYCTVVANPYEMLLKVVNKLDKDGNGIVSHTLHNNEVYTSLYPEGEYTIVRNPHNAANNYYKVNVVNNDLIDKYFNFKDAPNIMAFNAVGTPIQSVCNGMDTDGDKVLIFDGVMKDMIDRTMANNYPVILNTIKNEADPVELTLENIARVDERTAMSQNWIGSITNKAQYLVSVMHDIRNDNNYKGDKEKDIADVMNSQAALVVLSNVAIDYSKKIVEVDIEGKLDEIDRLHAAKKPIREYKKGKNKGRLMRKSRKKPKFWTSVTSSNPQMESFNCPMDMLIEHIDSIGKSNYRKNLSLKSLLADVSKSDKKADMKQVDDIIKLVNQLDGSVKEANAENVNSDDEEKLEKITKVNDAINKLDDKMKKKTIRKATMHKLLTEIAKFYDEKKSDNGRTSKVSGITIHLMNSLYRTQTTTFINLFKNQ